MVKKLLGGLLVAHGVICLVGAFFPFYPPVFLFYWFVNVHFVIELVIILLLGASQIVYGMYLALEKKGRQLKWYWLVTIVVVLVLLLLVFPTLEGLFTIW